MSISKLQISLCDALRQRDLPLVNKLLARGAKPDRDLIDGQNITPMQEAVLGNFLPGLEALVAAGGDVNFCGRYRVTPLMSAARMNNIEIGRWLLRQFANERLKSEFRETALTEALWHEHVDFADMLLQERPREIENVPDAAKIVMSRYNVDVAHWLLNHGASPDTEDAQGVPWLMVLSGADSDSRKQLLEILISAGADVNRTNPGGRTLLHRSADDRWLEEFMKLLQAGADPDRADGYGISVRSIVQNASRHSEIHRLFDAWEASNRARLAIDQAATPMGLEPV